MKRALISDIHANLEALNAVLADIRDEDGEALAAELGDAIYVHGDVTSADDIAAMVDRALEAFGTIDILINTAGIGGSSVRDLPEQEQWDKSIPSIVRREIALTVDQIKRLKERHEEQFRHLLRIECYIGTDIKQLEQRIPRYTPYHFPEKEKFKQRLFEIDKERRDLSLRLEEKTQGLEDKLLSLVNRCEQLSI